MKNGKTAIALGLMTLLGARAAYPASPEPPFAITQVVDGKDEQIQYQTLDHAQKKWNLCVLLPHVKDSFFLAVDYGLVKEARRQGVKLTILQAGGYDKLPQQISQFDDCLNSGADAILTAAISEAGLSAKFAEGMKRGVPQIAFVNAIFKAQVTTRMYVSNEQKGFLSGQYIVQHAKPGSKVLAFPGPQGSGWAENYLVGLKKSFDGSKIQLLETKFGDAGVSEQLPLVEDALQSYPDANVIWGGAPAAEAAVGAVAEAGLSDKMMIVSGYENQVMLKDMQAGKISAFAVEFPAAQGRIAVDQAVRILEKKQYASQYKVIPKLVTPATVKQVHLDDVVAPDDWQPVYKVD